MTDVLRALAVLVVLFLTGAPIILCVRARRREWTAAVFEAIAVGLLVQVAIGITALRTGHYSRVGLGVMTLAVIVVASVIAIVHRTHITWPRLDLPWLLITLGLVAVALFLRKYPVYFLWESGDMGEYVNRANRIAEGANLLQSFPHGFTVFLASTHTLLGPSGTVAGMPALGIITLLGATTLTRELGFRTAAAIVVGVIVVVHPIPVWFSEFPVSESLYAALLVSGLYFLVRARNEALISYGVISGLIFGITLIVRGNALLLAPILVLVLFASAVTDPKNVYRVHWWATGAALAALGISYGYDVHYPNVYFVDKQLDGLLPKPLFDLAKDFNLFDTTWQLLLVLVAGLALVLGAAELARRYLLKPVEAKQGVLWYVTGIGVVAMTLVVIAFLHRKGLVDGLERWGPLLVLLVAAGIVLVAVRPRKYLDGPTGLFVLLSVATFTILFAHRIKVPRDHHYLFYTDRYLFSEVLPLALVLAAVAVQAGAQTIAGVQSRKPWARAVAVAGLVVIVVGLLPPIAETWKITRQRLYGDAYGKMADVVEMAGGGKNGPIVYSGTKTRPPGFFFGNTYRVFAVPLGESFKGVKLVGVTAKNNLPDPEFDPASARAALAEAGQSHGYLLDLRDDGAQIFPDDEHTRYVGTVKYDIPNINRRIDASQEKFFEIPVLLDVYELS